MKIALSSVSLRKTLTLLTLGTLLVSVASVVAPPMALAANNLPSDRYDDYDEAKYQQEYADAASRVEVRRQDLQRADQSLQAARAEELRQRQALEQANQRLASARQEERDLITRLQDNQMQSERLYREMEQLVNEIRDVEGQLAQAQQQLEQMGQRKQKVEKDHTEAKAQLQRLSTLQTSAQTDFDTKKKASDENQNGLQQLKNAIAASEKAIAEAAQALQNLDQRLSALNTERQAAASDLELKEKYAARVQADFARIDPVIDGLRAEIKKAQDAGDAARVTELQAELGKRQDEKTQLRQDLTAANQSLAAAREKLQQTDTAIANKQSEKTAKQTLITNENQKIATAKADLDRREAAQPALTQAQQAAREQLNTANSAVEAQKREVEQAKARLDEIANRMTEIQARVDQLSQRSQQARRRHGEMDRRYRAFADDSSRANYRLGNLRQELQTIERDVNYTVDRLANAEAATRQADLSRTLAVNELQAADAERLRRLSRLEQVQNNVADARRKMDAEATPLGERDGEREGREFGATDGSSNGMRDGLAEGQAAGTAQGKKKFYDQGYAIGKAKGTERGRSDATATAETNGKKVGTETGRAAGLQVAYDTGKAQGLEHGAQTGSDTVAYKKGWDAGSERGLNEARQEAKAQEPIGFGNREREFLSAPLTEVVLGDEIVGGLSGLQAAGANHGDGRYYQPRPDEYPHPIIKRFYLEFYDAAYRTQLDATYDATYRASYDAFRRQNFEKARADYAARSYPEDQARGEREADALFYRQTYDVTYPVEYEARRSKYYTIAFDIAKVDAPTLKRGFDDGNAIASEEKGQREGRENAYRTNIEPEKKAAYDCGVAAATKKYTENPILEIVSAKLVDGDRDGVFRPGEGLFTEIVVKNYGLKPKTGLRTLVKVQGNDATSANPELGLPTLPPQSIARFRGFGRAEVLAAAAEGSSFGLAFALLDAEGKVFAQKNFTQAIQYPVVAQIQGFDGILIPGVPNTLRLALTNRSTKAQNLLVSLSLDASKVNVPAAQVTTETLAPGTQTTVAFQLTGRPEANFEAVPITIDVTQGSLRFATLVQTGSTVIRKHQVNPASLGLMLSGDLSKGGGKSLFSVGAPNTWDTWDLRVDGALSGATLDPYVAKAVHLLADPGTKLTRETAELLRDYLARGGMLVVWGSQLEEAGVLESLAAELGVNDTRRASVGTVYGAQFLRGLEAHTRGESAILQLANPKAVAVLGTGRDVLGAMNHAGEFTAQLSRVITLGVDVETLEPAAVSAILARLGALRLPFEKKLELATQNPQELSLVMDELIEEVRDDDLRRDVDWFYGHKKDTKLVKAIYHFLGGNPQRSAFAARYEEIYQAVNSMKDAGNSLAATRIIEGERVGGFFTKKSWKEVFCNENRNPKTPGICD